MNSALLDHLSPSRCRFLISEPNTFKWRPRPEAPKEKVSTWVQNQEVTLTWRQSPSPEVHKLPQSSLGRSGKATASCVWTLITERDEEEPVESHVNMNTHTVPLRVETYAVNSEDFPHRDAQQTDSTAGKQGTQTQSSEGQRRSALRDRRRGGYALQGPANAPSGD